MQKQKTEKIILVGLKLACEKHKHLLIDAYEMDGVRKIWACSVKDCNNEAQYYSRIQNIDLVDVI